jgi:hypothetical protein
MGGVGTNKGNQDIQFKYYDPLNSDHFDKRNMKIMPEGVYDGGICTKISDASAEVSPLVAEIGDGTHQARIHMQSAFTVSGLAPATPYIVLSWDWAGLTAWYMDIKASSVAIDDEDIVLAKCIYAGSVMTGIEYLTDLRDANGAKIGKSRVPRMMSEFLKVDPMPTPDMLVFVNGGWVTYGGEVVVVDGQESPAIIAPVVNNRIDLVWIDSGGVVNIETGVEAASPVAPSHTNKIPIAELNLTPGVANITADMIKDVRPFLSLAGGAGIQGVISGFLLMGA